jgi:hypothetical protein
MSVQIYKEIFLNKIRRRKKVYTKTNQEYIDNNKEFLEINNIEVMNDIDETNIENYFDYVIIENILDKNVDFNSIIYKYKKILKIEGVIMFINSVDVKTHNCFIKNIIYYTHLFTGIDYRTVKINEIYDMFLENQLKIIDVYRLHSEENFITYKDTYLISCIKL